MTEDPKTTPARLPVTGYLVVTFNCPACGGYYERDDFGHYDCSCGAKLDVMEVASVEP